MITTVENSAVEYKEAIEFIFNESGNIYLNVNAITGRFEIWSGFGYQRLIGEGSTVLQCVQQAMGNKDLIYKDIT